MTARQPRQRDEKYLAFVRTRPCCVCGRPLCHWRLADPGCHKIQHSMNEAEFWGTFGINPFEIAKRLYAEGGHPNEKQPKKRKSPIKSRGFAKGPKRKMQSRGFQ